jgi:ankyrin repeat protein
VKILLEANEINLRRQANKYYYYTPLHLALREEEASIVQLLPDHHSVDDGISTDTDDDGHTPIRLAIDNPDKDCLYQLVMHPKVGPKEFSYDELRTILTVCSGSGIEASDWSGSIWNKKAEGGVVDEDNWTLADIAGKYGHPNLEEHLRNNMGNSAKPAPPLHPSTFVGEYLGRSFTDFCTHDQSHAITLGQ